MSHQETLNQDGKDGAWIEFLETDSSNYFFKKMSTLKTWVFLSFFFQSISHKIVVVTKLISFSPTFLKSWVDISGNIAGVVWGSQYY